MPLNVVNIINYMDFDNKFYSFLGLKEQSSGFNETSSLFLKAYRLTRDKNKAEDLLMDTIADLYEKAKNGKIPLDANLKAYTYTSLRNRFIDEYRKKQTNLNYVSDIKYIEKEKQKSSKGMQEKAEIIHDCFIKLGNMCQEILTLDTLGLKQNEISKKLSISQGEVAKRINKCLDELTKIANNYKQNEETI